MGSASECGRICVITQREIANTGAEWQLAQNVVEKDYALGWMLAGIAQHPVRRSWAFKGVGGHEILPSGGHVAARWRPTVLPSGGQQNCPR